MVLKSGYSFKSEASDESTKTYWADIKNPNGYYDTVSLTQVSNAPNLSGVSSTNKNYYLDIKTKTLIESKGWKFLSEGSREIRGKKIPFYNYSNGKYHVTLYSFTVDMNSPTWYNITCKLVE